MYIVTLAHFTEDYSDGNSYVVRLIVWFTRLPVRVTAAPATRTRLARWFAIKTRVD